MAPAEGDVLSELYAWDTLVEDDFALPADDPRRDEDKVEDAYEQMIHTASADASDVVLSLAAQLLVKHFFRFPHVQINVVDVLLKLCGPARSQAVRIHTLRSLLQIVKTPPEAAAASTPTSAAGIARKNTQMWMQRINQAVQKLLEMEKSSVILRQITPLRNALDERLDLPEPEHKQSSLYKAGELSGNTSPTERSRKQPRDEKESADGANVDQRDAKKTRRDDYQTSAKSPSESKIVKLTRDETVGDVAMRANLNGRLVENEQRTRRLPNSTSPRNCPPGPYLFLGSVPRHTPNEEIVDFLEPVCPGLETMRVQIKQPDHNATAYAFVSLPSIEKARDAIRYVAANKFRGRTFLNANFARGPPVDTLLFVERLDETVSMEDEGAVRDLEDFSKVDPDVWELLCEQLERFGPLTAPEKGVVRFRSTEHAKAVIRKMHFNVKGHDIYPVYDTKEQFAIDSTRRGHHAYNSNKQSFTLKSGRLVGGDAEYRGGKGRYKDEDDPMDGGRHERMMSKKYGSSGRSRSPPRSDRGSARGRSRSRSPKARYDAYPPGPPKDRRLLHSRSRSPIVIGKPVGYGTPLSNKENYRSKYRQRSLSPVDVRGHESPMRVDEVRGRTREREGPWMGPPEDSRERRGRGSYHRSGSPSPSSSSRRGGRDDVGQPPRMSTFRRDDGRPSYRREESPQEERGRMPPPGVLPRPRSASRSPPRYGKYSTGSASSRPRSRSRSPPHQDVRMSSGSKRSSGYRSREDHPIESGPPEPERPRYADDRSIAEIARDEQQERQRYLQQQQQQGRRDFRDSDLSRYGSGGRGGRGGGRGRPDSDDRSRAEFHAPPPFRGGGRGGMYRQDSAPQARSPSPPPQPQRENYGRERRDEFAQRGRPSAYSPPPSPLLQDAYPPTKNMPEPFPQESERAPRDSSRHERRHHSRRERSRDDKSHRSHRERREKHSRSERSLTPSPVRRASESSGRKSSGPSPRRSFSRRSDVDNQVEESSATDKPSRSKNDDESEPQKDSKSDVRLVRDELFAGMDDLAVDYEEDDE